MMITKMYRIASYYLPTMLGTVGVTAINTVLLLNVIYALTGWLSATIGACMYDIIGRRKMMMSSTIGIVICFIFIAASTATFEKTKEKSMSILSILFIYIFGVVFAFAYTSMQPVYVPEVLTTQMRAKGMVFYQLFFNVSGGILIFTTSIAMKNIGYWFYVFFIFWNTFSCTIMYFFFVETKGRSLEELDVIFRSKNPRKTSTQKLDMREETEA